MAQTLLTNGWPNPGAIQAPAASNVWVLPATVGDRVVLQFAKTSGGAGFLPSMEVFSPDGRSLGTKSGTTTARLDLQASTTGDFTVRMKDSLGTGTGTYQLWLAQIPTVSTVPAGDQGGALVNGTNAQGTISVGDLDAWSVAANAGDRITVQLGELTGGAAFSPLIEIFGPDGAQLALNAGATAARVNVQATRAGAYTVLVSDGGQTGSGTYELHLAQAPGEFVVPGGDEGGMLATGVDVDGIIPLGDLDLWRFDAIAGEHLHLQITELTGGASFTPRVEVFGPGGDGKTSQNATSTMIDTAVETPGAYTVLVSDANQNGAGTYRLRLTRSSIGPAASNVLTNGSQQIGAIAATGQTESWSFTASSGDAIVVRAGEIQQTGAFSPRLKLLGPGGVQVALTTGANATEVVETATNSGTFTVVVDSSGAGTGTYRISLAKTGSAPVSVPSDEGGSLANGATQIGSIDLGDLDTWVFAANEGENIVVRAGELTGSLSPQLRLYGPNGALLDTSSGATATEVLARATNAGTFLVVMGDLSSGYAGTGNYRLTLMKTGDPVITSPGDEGGSVMNGSSNTGGIELGDMDAWTFIANAGDNIVVRAGELTASLTPQLRLYGPNGALLDSSYGAVAAEVTYRATNSGTFTIAASDLSSGFVGSGNYQLTLARTAAPLNISVGDEGGGMTNGITYLGSIETGDLDSWSIAARPGESLVIRMGETSGVLAPQLRLFGPNGVLLDNSYGAVATEVTARATNDGAFLVVASDLSSGFAGSGNYKLTLARSGAAPEISPDDEGGAAGNGTMQMGSIYTGDLDSWVFEAKAGESIVARMGETATSSLSPYLRLYGPNGLLLDSSYGAVAAEVGFRATNSGTFVLVAGDLSNGFAGSGNYRLTRVKTGEPLVTSLGDEGGAMDGRDYYDGMIESGDIDAWTFSIRAGERISVSLSELISSSPLTPQLRLYGRDGTLLRSVYGAAVTQVTDYSVPESGTYLLVASDLSSGFAGTGTYRLSVNWLSDTVKLYPPDFSGGGPRLLSVGGTAGANYVVITATNLAMPLNLWTPLTNTFDQFGVANLITTFGSSEPQRFFKLVAP